jgi:hypothetical protein|tara:strand:- start:44 stop:169 length:126 start_codon:yes stop_codon:yes gene_type:complete
MRRTQKQMKEELQAYKYLALFILGFGMGWVIKHIYILNWGI